MTIRNRFGAGLVVAVALAGVAMTPGVAPAAVVAQSVSESVSASATRFVPGPGGVSTPILVIETASRTVLPPADLTVTSVGDNGTSSTATLDITAYTGPLSTATSTPSMSLLGTFITTGSGGSGSIDFAFGLTEAHSYVLSANTTLLGPSGPVVATSGTLLAGDYRMLAGASNASFGLTVSPVPEPAALAAGAVAALAVLRRRRPGC